MSCSQMFGAEGEKGGAPGLGGLWLRHMQRLRLRPALAGMVGVWAAQAGPPSSPTVVLKAPFQALHTLPLGRVRAGPCRAVWDKGVGWGACGSGAGPLRG